MSSNTMSFALPESLRAYIDERVQSGHYGNASGYRGELVRRDQEGQARKRLRELSTDGLESGPTRPLNRRTVADLRNKALGPQT